MTAAAELQAQLGLLVHAGPWTVADVEALPENGSKYEILTTGVLTVSPAAGTTHQIASRRFANALEQAAEDADADVAVLEAVNLVLPGERLTIPDILIVDGAAADARPTHYRPPQVRVVVEIVSPSSKPADRAIKPDLYAEAGIPVYLRLELEPAPQLLVFILDGNSYRLSASVEAGTEQTVDVGFGLTVDPARLIARRPS